MPKDLSCTYMLSAVYNCTSSIFLNQVQQVHHGNTRIFMNIKVVFKVIITPLALIMY